MIKIIAAIFLFLTLNWIDFFPGDIFRSGKIRYLMLFLVPISFFFFKKRLSWAPAYFIALAVLSFVIHNYMTYSAFPIFTILAVSSVAYYVLGMGRSLIGSVLVCSGLFQAFTAALQMGGVYYGFRLANSSDIGMPVGFMGHQTVLGIFLVMAMCPALWRKHYLMAGFMGIVAIATYSTMAWASLGAVLTIYVWHRATFKKAVAFAIGGLLCVLVAYLIAPGHSVLSFHGRWFIWPFGVRAIMEHPYFGVGIGGWAGHYIPLYSAEILKVFNTHLPRQLHCDYLDFIVEYGFIAALPFVFALWQFLRNFRPSWQHAVCVAVLVNSLGNFPLCLANISLIFLVCWGLSSRV